MASSLHHAKGALQRRIVRTVEHDWQVHKARFRRWMGAEQSVLSVVQGEVVHPGERHAIFVIWQRAETSWSVWNMLDGLDRAGINATLVVNHPLSEDRLEALRMRCARVMLRDNSGRDIGGYRDATLLLRKEGSPERVLYLNDSVYIFERGLDALLEQLACSKADVCSAFECWRPRLHYQSFCYSVSGTFFASAGWQGFWSNYLPANSRRWAIHKGEIGASRVMNRHAKSIEVVFTPAKLQQKMADLTQDELLALIGHLPLACRPDPRGLSSLDRSALMREIGECLMAFSQIHTGGMLFRRFMDCPLMKRDLIFRDLLSINELDTLLDAVGHEGHGSEILSEMRKRGSCASGGSWDKARVRAGTL